MSGDGLKDKLKANINAIYLGQMARDIGHDVANVITIMIGKTRIVKGLLDKEPLDKEKIKKMISDVENNFQRILNIIFYQRVYYIKEADAIFSYTQSEEMVQDLKNLFEDRLTKKGVKLTIENGLTPADSFNINKFLILRSLSYLIQNAVESMRLDNPEIDYIVTVKIVKNGSGVAIHLVDNGEKVEESVIKTMFEPFFSTKNDVAAMGLGLSMLVELLQKINASVRFNQSGETKEFVIEIPA